MHVHTLLYTSLVVRLNSHHYSLQRKIHLKGFSVKRIHCALFVRLEWSVLMMTLIFDVLKTVLSRLEDLKRGFFCGGNINPMISPGLGEAIGSVCASWSAAPGKFSAVLALFYLISRQIFLCRVS